MTGPQVGDRISEYVLDALVGAGSFGQVWKAHHHIWKTDVVAVKVPTDSQFVRNLQKEGITIHGLKHPNIVRAIGLDPYADTPYLVMEYVDGPSLAELIAQHPKGMPLPAVERIMAGILHALEHAHTSGVIHRDIKPANILIAGGKNRAAETIKMEDVKVTDFGLGKAGEITAASILQSGSLLAEDGKSISGTLAYMAPEQRDGGETDARSDLYSVGVVLFEMVCGERPSGSDMPCHLRQELPTWVDLVFGRLYTRRERRYGSAAEVRRAIEAGSTPPVIRSAPYSAATAPPPIPTAARKIDGPSCQSCGATIESGDHFCIACGVQHVAQPRRCESCGGYPDADDRFCVFCGSDLPERIG